eukprot:gene51174-62578_t
METTVSSDKAVEEIIVDENDFYHVLGVPKDVTDKQITVAYKKLALKYHPDRNVDDEYAAAKYKAVQEAYQTLIDPAKRKQYDARGATTPESAPPAVETGESSGLGSLGKVFGAVMSRLGNITSVVSGVNTDILETAQAICKNGGIEGGGPPLDPRVSDLTW